MQWERLAFVLNVLPRVIDDVHIAKELVDNVAHGYLRGVLPYTGSPKPLSESATTFPSCRY